MKREVQHIVRICPALDKQMNESTPQNDSHFAFVLATKTPDAGKIPSRRGLCGTCVQEGERETKGQNQKHRERGREGRSERASEREKERKKER